MSGGLRQKVTEPSNLVKQFTNLYCDLIPNLYDVKSDTFLNKIRSALKDLRRLKYDRNKQHKRDFYIDINYEEPAVRCAYLYAYSILNTYIVYFEISNHFKTIEVLPPSLSKKTLKICCLAGGPATEAVAVSKAIDDFRRKHSGDDDLLLDIQVTVVDIVSEWKNEGEALIKAVNNFSTLFDTKKIHIHYSFLKADLLKPFEAALEQTIAEADIVTIVKFASSIEEKSAKVCITCLDGMIKKVIGLMSDNSCLFMLDLDGGKIFKQNVKVLSRYLVWTLERSPHKMYRLLPKTLQSMEACIDFRNAAKSETLFPTVFTTISSCFWIKIDIKTEEQNAKAAENKTNKGI